MDTLELRTQLKALEAERAAAAEWGLTGVPAYLNDLEGEIEVWRAAYTSTAVTDIASLRSALSGPQVGERHRSYLQDHGRGQRHARLVLGRRPLPRRARGARPRRAARG